MICCICRKPIEGKGMISEFGITHTYCAFKAYKETYGKKLPWSQVYPFSRFFRIRLFFRNTIKRIKTIKICTRLITLVFGKVK
jgi:hypothetical protein